MIPYYDGRPAICIFEETQTQSELNNLIVKLGELGGNFMIDAPFIKPDGRTWINEDDMVKSYVRIFSLDKFQGHAARYREILQRHWPVNQA